MNEEFVNIEELGLSEEELFAPYDNSTADSEKITAPRYSYWKSVFRVFFKKKLNIVILAILAVLVMFIYIYPAVIQYNPDVDPYRYLLEENGKHLTPAQAIEKYGFSLKWILGAGGSGESVLLAAAGGAKHQVVFHFGNAAVSL